MAVGHNIGGQAYGGIYQQPSVAELTLSEPARMASHLADAERKMTREEDRETQAKAKQSTILTTAEVMPTYTGGEAAMRHYITAKLNLTPAEMEAVRVGKLRATFVIGADGSVIPPLSGVRFFYGFVPSLLRSTGVLPTSHLPFVVSAISLRMH